MRRAGFLLLLLFSSCQASPRILTSEGIVPPQVWSAEEQANDLAFHTLRTTPEASFHVIRLKGAEKLHTHDTHDLLVTMLSGKAKITIGEQVFTMNPGDVLEVPKGTRHKAENLSRDASEVYAVFTPPLNGKDYHPVE